MSYTVEGTIEVQERFEVETEADAVIAFKEKYGTYPDSVGGRTVVGGCEACKCPIFDGDKYVSGDDGEHTCQGCYEQDVQGPDNVEVEGDGFSLG